MNQYWFIVLEPILEPMVYTGTVWYTIPTCLWFCIQYQCHLVHWFRTKTSDPIGNQRALRTLVHDQYQCQYPYQCGSSLVHRFIGSEPEPMIQYGNQWIIGHWSRSNAMTSLEVLVLYTIPMWVVTVLEPMFVGSLDVYVVCSRFVCLFKFVVYSFNSCSFIHIPYLFIWLTFLHWSSCQLMFVYLGPMVFV